MTSGHRNGPKPTPRLPGENEGLWQLDRRLKPFEYRSVEERLRIVWEETWVDTPATQRLRQRFYFNLWKVRVGSLSSGRGSFIIGRASAGTSSFLRELAREHRQLHGKRIALVDMPHTLEYRDLLIAFRKALGHEPRGRESSGEQEVSLYQELGRSDVVGFAVDMMEHLLHATPSRRKLTLFLLRHVGKRANVHLVLAMPPKLLDEADKAYNGPIPAESQPQWIRDGRPFQEFRLDPLRIDDAYVDLLDAWERSIPLLEASNLAEREMALHLYSLCDGNHGRLATVLRRAAAEAITSGRERVTIELLDDMGFRPPASFSVFRF